MEVLLGPNGSKNRNEGWNEGSDGPPGARNIGPPGPQDRNEGSNGPSRAAKIGMKNWNEKSD